MKKKQATVLFVLLLIVALLGGVFFYVAHLYNGTGLSLIAQWDEAYDYNGKLLLSGDRQEALRVKTVGAAEFQSVFLTRVDLTPFGFEGKEFSYYRIDLQADGGIPKTTSRAGDASGKAPSGTVKTYLYTPDAEQEGFWPVLKSERLVYTAEDGARYCIHPTDGLCYPMFADSIEGVDPYGKDVIAFSANGSYAVGMQGKELTVYHTDPMDDSLRIVDVKTVSLSKYQQVSFGAFAGNTTAYLMTDQGYVALDCVTGELADALLDDKGEYSDPVCRVYAQRVDVEEEEHRAVWSHLLLGEERKTPKLEDFESFEIISVSPGGAYVAIRAHGAEEEILIATEKRAFSLSSVLEEGMNVERIDFVYENLIYVTVKNSEGKEMSFCYKVCF